MFKNNRYAFTLAAFAALIVGIALHANAELVTFDTQAAWQAALSNSGVQYTFNGITPGDSFATNPFNFGPFTLTANGTPPIGNDVVKSGLGNVTIDGTPFASMFLDKTRSVELDFTHPVTAFGAQFESGLGNAFNFGVFLHGSQTAVNVSGPATTNQYYGVISDVPIDRIDFIFNGIGDPLIVNFDNVGLSSIPEPSSLMLLGAGASLFAAYGCWRLRTRKIEVRSNQI